MPRTLLDKVKTFENAFDIAKRVANRESSWTSEAKSMQSNRTQLCKFCKRLLGENFPIAQDIIPFVFDAKELKKETWKDIEWYEGLYMISNMGRVKAINYRETGENAVMRLGTNWRYAIIKLHKNWKIKAYLVHRLVATHFIPNPENKPEVNHKKWNKFDNRAPELEWSTKSENIKHSFSVLWQKPSKALLWRKGKKNHLSKPIIQLTLDGNLIKEWENAVIAEETLGIYQTNIRSCCNWRAKSAWWFRWKFKE